MKNFYFVDNETGEDFIVVTDTLRDAIHIASTYFEEPQFLREISDYEAEMIGVDTYQKGRFKMESLIIARALLLLACVLFLVVPNQARRRPGPPHKYTRK